MRKWVFGLLACAAVFFGGPVWAAVTANSVVTAQTPTRILAIFGITALCTAPAVPYTCCTGSGGGCVAGTNYTLYTAGANGSKCMALWMTSNDTATHAINFQLVNSATSPTTKGPGTIVTSTASGVSGTFTTPQSVMSPSNWPGLGLDSDNNPYFSLSANDSLVANFATAFTSGDVVAFGGSCSDF